VRGWTWTCWLASLVAARLTPSLPDLTYPIPSANRGIESGPDKSVFDASSWDGIALKMSEPVQIASIRRASRLQ
jgi:hypothetical protein